VTLEQPPPSAPILDAVCSLLRRSSFDDARFLHPGEFASSHAEALGEEAAKQAGAHPVTDVWLEAPAWLVARSAVERQVGRRVPGRAPGPRARRGTLHITRLLLEEHLLRYSPRARMRRVHPQLRRNVLGAACLEWAAITGSAPLPPSVAVPTWGFEISHRLLSGLRRSTPPPNPPETDPLRAFVGQEVVSSFDNPDILRFAPALESRLQLLLLRIVDAYATAVRRDPRELVMQRFFDEPRLFPETDALRSAADAYRGEFDEEVLRIRNHLGDIDRRSDQPIRASHQRHRAEHDLALLDDLVERAGLLEKPRLAKRLRAARRQVSTGLRAYRSLVSAERRKITSWNRQVRDLSAQVRVSLPKSPWTVEQAAASSRLIAQAEALGLPATDPEIAELHEAVAGASRRASSIFNSLTSQRTQNETLAASRLGETLEEGHQIDGRNRAECRRLVELHGEATHHIEVLGALGGSPSPQQIGRLNAIRLKITEYEKRVHRLEQAIVDLEAAIAQQRLDSREILGSGLDLCRTLTDLARAADSACLECAGDVHVADLVSRCERLIDTATREVARIEEQACVTYADKADSLSACLASMRITARQQLRDLTVIEEELSVLEGAAFHLELDPSPIEALRARCSDLRHQYSTLLSERRAQIDAVRGLASGLEIEARDVFRRESSADKAAQVAAKVRRLETSRVLIQPFRDDEALATLVDQATRLAERAGSTFSTSLERQVSALRSVAASAQERCQSIGVCSWREIDELKDLSSQLDAVRLRLEELQALALLDSRAAIAEVDAAQVKVNGLLDRYDAFLGEATAALDQIADDAGDLIRAVESVRSPQRAISTDDLPAAIRAVAVHATHAAALNEQAGTAPPDPNLAGHRVFEILRRIETTIVDARRLLLNAAAEDCRARSSRFLTSPIETKQQHSSCGSARGHLTATTAAVAELERAPSTAGPPPVHRWLVEVRDLDQRLAKVMGRYERTLEARLQALEQIRTALAHDPFRLTVRTTPFATHVSTLKKRLRQLDAARRQLAGAHSWRVDQGLAGLFEAIDGQLETAAQQADSVGARLLAHLAGLRKGIEARAARLRREASWYSAPLAVLRAARLRRKARAVAETEARLRPEIQQPTNVVRIDHHRAARRNTA